MIRACVANTSLAPISSTSLIYSYLFYPILDGDVLHEVHNVHQPVVQELALGHLGRVQTPGWGGTEQLLVVGQECGGYDICPPGGGRGTKLGPG